MVRKLSLMIVLTLGLVPLVAQALGLGDIQLNSALNQKFNAEIRLMSVAKGEVDDIKVVMASDEAFKRSGVDRSFLLTKLSFKPEQKADGSAVIRVTSNEPIREPFLNFLIEVNWPKGRLVREYTVLLDPPVTLERKPAPIQAPAVTQKSVKTPPAPANTMQAEKPTPMVDTPYAGGVEEVKVKKNSSLWVIARNHKHAGVDHNRMMMAIYHANPRAFIKNNINRLKQGAILRIPSKEDVLELGVSAAQKEYKKHVEDWRADTASKDQDSLPEPMPDTIADVKPAEVQAETDKPAGQSMLEEIEKFEAKMEQQSQSEPEMSEPEAELKIATARPEGEGEAGPSEDSEAEETITRLKQELLIVEEDADRARSEGEELSSRVNSLENQLEDLERILELKSEQLAGLQAALARSEEQQSFLEKNNKILEEDLAASREQAAMEPTEVADSSMAKESETEILAEESKPEPMVEESKPEPMVEESKPEPMVEESKPEPMVEESKPESVIKPMTEDEPKPAKIVSASPDEPSLLDEIMGNPTMLGIAVGVIIILLALAWLLLSRKRANATDFQESILLSSTEDDVASSLDEANDIPTHTEETSFLSDFSPSDIDALQDETGEVDPLSEADVYIAYGRYQQAEELIRQAIDKEPERDILKYKLFEILYAVKNADDFIALAEETAGTVTETNDRASWQRVLSMGKLLSPQNPMFVNAAEIDAEDDLFSLDDDLLEEELDENDFADLDATLTQSDFGIDKAESANEESTDTDDEPGEFSESDLLELSGDLDDTGVGLDDFEFETNLDDESINAVMNELEGLDEAEGTTESKNDDEESEDDFMLSLSDLEDEAEKTVLSLNASTTADEDTDEAPEIDLELMDEDSSMESPEDELLAKELEETVIDFPEQTPEPAEFELDDPMKDMDVSESSDDEMQDEVKTKLDLARAYVEMGDADGAADILEEVLSEGNDAQKQEAQEIKDTLS